MNEEDILESVEFKLMLDSSGSVEVVAVLFDPTSNRVTLPFDSKVSGLILIDNAYDSAWPKLPMMFHLLSDKVRIQQSSEDPPLSERQSSLYARAAIAYFNRSHAVQRLLAKGVVKH